MSVFRSSEACPVYNRPSSSNALRSKPDFVATTFLALNIVIWVQFPIRFADALQPAVQYYAEVGGNPHAGDAIATGFRVKITF